MVLADRAGLEPRLWGPPLVSPGGGGRGGLRAPVRMQRLQCLQERGSPQHCSACRGLGQAAVLPFLSGRPPVGLPGQVSLLSQGEEASASSAGPVPAGRVNKAGSQLQPAATAAPPPHVLLAQARGLARSRGYRCLLEHLGHWALCVCVGGVPLWGRVESAGKMGGGVMVQWVGLCQHAKGLAGGPRSTSP